MFLQPFSVFFSLLQSSRPFLHFQEEEEEERKPTAILYTKQDKEEQERKKERKKQYNQTRLALLCLALLEVGWVLITLLCVRIHCICNVVERLVRSKY